MAHVNVLPMLLGAMLVDDPFREAMIKDVDATLDGYGIRVTPREYHALRRMVESFASRRCDEAVALMRGECPVWPCREFQLSSPDQYAALRDDPPRDA